MWQVICIEGIVLRSLPLRFNTLHLPLAQQLSRHAVTLAAAVEFCPRKPRMYLFSVVRLWVGVLCSYGDHFFVCRESKRFLPPFLPRRRGSSLSCLLLCPPVNTEIWKNASTLHLTWLGLRKDWLLRVAFDNRALQRVDSVKWCFWGAYRRAAALRTTGQLWAAVNATQGSGRPNRLDRQVDNQWNGHFGSWTIESVSCG